MFFARAVTPTRTNIRRALSHSREAGKKQQVEYDVDILSKQLEHMIYQKDKTHCKQLNITPRPIQTLVRVHLHSPAESGVGYYDDESTGAVSVASVADLVSSWFCAQQVDNVFIALTNDGRNIDEWFPGGCREPNPFD